MEKIIVCMKQVLDPEAPSSAFKIDTEANQLIPPRGVPPVLNPFDENALEAALKLKESQGAQIIVISMGRSLAKPVVRKSLAVGADELILLEDDAFADTDSHATAYILATAIKKLGEYSLIICGRQAADTDSGQVGSGIAAILDIPCIIAAGKIESINGKLIVKRIVSDGHEVLEVPMPAVVTASNEIGELRAANVKDLMEAQKKQITVWNAGELGIDSSVEKRVNLLKLYAPAHRESKCETIESENPEDAGARLALKLRDTNLI